jgi:hypothetical protein
MAFEPKVTTFSEVTTRLRQIGKYLTNVDKSLERLRWDLLPKKRKKKTTSTRKKGGGHEDAGSKPPKGWPP